MPEDQQTYYINCLDQRSKPIARYVDVGPFDKAVERAFERHKEAKRVTIYDPKTHRCVHDSDRSQDRLGALEYPDRDYDPAWFGIPNEKTQSMDPSRVLQEIVAYNDEPKVLTRPVGKYVMVTLSEDYRLLMATLAEEHDRLESGSIDNLPAVHAIGKLYDQLQPGLDYLDHGTPEERDRRDEALEKEQKQHPEQQQRAVDKDLEYQPVNEHEESQRQTLIREIWRAYGTEDAVDLAQKLFRARDEVDINRLLISQRSKVDLSEVYRLLQIPDTHLERHARDGWPGIASGIARHFEKPSIDPVAKKNENNYGHWRSICISTSSACGSAQRINTRIRCLSLSERSSGWWESIETTCCCRILRKPRCRRRPPWLGRGSSKEPRKLSDNLKHARNAALAREEVPEFRLPAPPPPTAPCFEATKVQDDLPSERFHRPQVCPRNARGATYPGAIQQPAKGPRKSSDSHESLTGAETCTLCRIGPA